MTHRKFIEEYLKSVHQDLISQNGISICKNCGIEPLGLIKDIDKIVKETNIDDSGFNSEIDDLNPDGSKRF